MSNEFSLPIESNSLEHLLMPSWAREENASSVHEGINKKTYKDHWEGKEQNRRSFRNQNTSKERHFSSPRKTFENDRKDRSGSSQQHGRNARQQHESKPAPLLSGWAIDFIPTHRAVDGVAKQMKTEAKAYPLFELTRLILEKPTRYDVILSSVTSSEGTASRLVQYIGDGSLWGSEKEALAYVIKKHRDQFYRSEQITTDPPKGNYSSVAICGMSQQLLGPPNHHEYQTKINQLHTERFLHLPLDVFKSRIQLLRDEEILQRWKDEQSKKEEFYPLNSVEGAEAIVLKSLFEVEEHFKKEHAPELFVEVGEKVKLSGNSLLHLSGTPIQIFAKNALEELRRFPLRLSQVLAEDFMARGLQVFKAHENITYVSVARPRHLDRESAPLADNLEAILNYLEHYPKNSRAEQWKGILESRACSSKEAELAVAKDLSWLIHQGHIINYAFRGLEVVK